MSLFAILYTSYHGEIILIVGQNKVGVDLWFAVVLFVLLILVLNWLTARIRDLRLLPSRFKFYWQTRKVKDAEQARQQAIIYALNEEYVRAVQQMQMIQSLSVSDQLWIALWMNQAQMVDELDTVLAKIVHSGRYSSSWLIWFRAYLAYQQQQSDRAVSILEDAIKRNIHTKDIVQSLVRYVNISNHYSILIEHESVIRRFLPHSEAVSVLGLSYAALFDRFIKRDDIRGLVQKVGSLSRDISQDKTMAYYKLYSLSHTKQWDQLVYQLSQLTLLEDPRILGLIIDSELPISNKIQVLDKALSRAPDEADLLYVRSYLAAQSGESLLDTAQLIERSVKGRFLSH